MTDFTGRTALITGAASGIGRATAELLAVRGAQVFLTDRDQTGLDSTLANLIEQEEIAHSAYLDVTNQRSCQQAVQECVSKLGSIDIVVHAAGMFDTTPVGGNDMEIWREVVEVNLVGAAYLMNVVIPELAPNSSLITLSSIASSRSGAGVSAYAASKAGIESFTRSLARELAPRTRVNSVAPGMIDTPMGQRARGSSSGSQPDQIPLNRMGLPSEVAEAIVFLCSDGASYITGETLQVTGGLVMK